MESFNGSTKKGRGIILFLMPFVLLTAGCATPHARVWQSQLWKAPETGDNELSELGQLKTEESTFSLICTEFRQVSNPRNALIGIGISCRNDTNDTLPLEYNPIQVVDAALTIMKPLPIDHVMYRLYGGNLREGAQLGRLAETSTPLASSGDSLLESALVGVINAYRNYEHGAIITELHKKEALPYDLYYRSFTPTSLPSGVSTTWMAYYPVTTDTLTVILQGLKVEKGVVFSKPPLPPSPPPSREEFKIIHPAVFITTAIIIIGITITLQS